MTKHSIWFEELDLMIVIIIPIGYQPEFSVLKSHVDAVKGIVTPAEIVIEVKEI